MRVRPVMVLSGVRLSAAACGARFEAAPVAADADAGVGASSTGGNTGARPTTAAESPPAVDGGAP